MQPNSLTVRVRRKGVIDRIMPSWLAPFCVVDSRVAPGTVLVEVGQHSYSVTLPKT